MRLICSWAWVQLRGEASRNPKPLPSPASRPLLPPLPQPSPSTYPNSELHPHSCHPSESCFPTPDWLETQWTPTQPGERAENTRQRGFNDVIFDRWETDQRCHSIRPSCADSMRYSWTRSHASRIRLCQSPGAQGSQEGQSPLKRFETQTRTHLGSSMQKGNCKVQMN